MYIYILRDVFNSVRRKHIMYILYNVFTNCDEFVSSDSSGRSGGGVSPFAGGVFGCGWRDTSERRRRGGGDKTVDRRD